MVKRRLPKVYVAGPMTSSGDFATNIREGIRFGTCLVNDGFIPFVPHLDVIWSLTTAISWDTLLMYDKEWIRACDALYRLPGKSKGAAREVRHANKLGIPVFTSYRKLTEWRDQFMTGPKSILPKVTRSSQSKKAVKGRSSNGRNTKKKGRR